MPKPFLHMIGIFILHIYQRSDPLHNDVSLTSFKFQHDPSKISHALIYKIKVLYWHRWFH